ncbi:MAG: hypothetical protein AAF500_17535 [Myxococcota bacterium]
MNETMLKLRIWARAEVALGKMNAKRTGARFATMAVAVGLALLAVGMVNLGAFEYLAEAHGKADAAFLLAGANGLLAALLALASQRARSRPEEEMVREIREMAMNELAADAGLVRAELQRMTGHVRRIEDGLSALSSASSSGVAMMASVGPVLEMIVQALKHRKSSSES